MRGAWLTTAEAADILGISRRRIQQYCAGGRVLGAYRAGRDWMIPLHTNGKPLISGPENRKGPIPKWRMEAAHKRRARKRQ